MRLRPAVLLDERIDHLQQGPLLGRGERVDLLETSYEPTISETSNGLVGVILAKDAVGRSLQGAADLHDLLK